MSKFDTHGGYFAPKDYLRVNEGGSHEENPNGGVQIGVDPEGNPNLLEEGEPVYKDYVYSDNIEAEEQFLVDNNLPKKYTGKLYSKIADDLFSEAEERPLDPISRNGLEALLGRLADAQESQKQAKEQRDLEDELAQLSPEELDQLEAMLAQGEQEQIAPEQAPMEASPEQMMGPAESIPTEGMPMMANGGFLRVFGDGTPGRVVPGDPGVKPQGSSVGGGGREVFSFDNLNYGDNYVAPEVPSLLEMALGSDNKVVRAIDDAQEWWDNSTVGKVASFLIPEDATQAFGSPLMRQAGRVTGPIGRSVWRGLKKIGNAIKNAPGKLVEASGRKTMLQEARAVVDEAKAASSAARNTANAIADEVKIARANLAADPNNKALQQTLAELEARSARADVDALKASAKTTRAQVEAANKTIGAFTGGPMYNRAALEEEIAGLEKIYKEKSALAAAEGATDEVKAAAEVAAKELEKAKSAKNKWWNHGEWQYKMPIVGSGIGYGVHAVEEEKHDNAKHRILANGGNLFWPGGYKSPFSYGVLRNFPMTLGTSDVVPPVFTIGNGAIGSGILRSNTILEPSYVFADAPSSPSVSGVATSNQDGIHNAFVINDENHSSEVLAPSYVYADGPAGYNFPNQVINTRPDGLKITPHPISDITSSAAEDDKSTSDPNNLLPTRPRYAGAIGSGLLGLYNVFQQPDRYTVPHINPQLPEGRINLQNQVYNPIDQNMIANAQIAQGNATNRALRNSGLGPSSAAAILAADNNTTGNLGTGFIQAWEANNQRRNAVTAANNQAEAQRAQFDYTVDAARKQALNDAAVRNTQNDLMVQRLNYEAEGDKYNSISNQISNGLQALSGIGQENFAMNQINTNPAFLGYRTGVNGGIFYNPLTGRMEAISTIPEKNTEAKVTTATALKPVPAFNVGSVPKYSSDPFMGYNKGLDLTFRPLVPFKKKNN